MKGIHKTALLILGMLVMTGCGGLQDSRESLRLEMPEYQPAESPQPQEKKKSGQADYDLTEMNQDMLYATLFQILIDPRKYEGKTVRVKGLYHASTSRDGGQLRHCCVVRDSRGCCAQDMEFIWGDGTHAYPDEYPAENAGITVQGTVEVYQEPQDEKNVSCRLKGAALTVEGDSQ